MQLNQDMPIGSAIALLKKEIDDRQRALTALEAMVSQSAGRGAVAQVNGHAPRAAPTSGRGGKRPKIGEAAVEILRAAGRPMHGLREVLPALEAQGYKISHRAGLATMLLRTKRVVRTAPGTFALKEAA
jgi:hypothetical protein